MAVTLDDVTTHVRYVDVLIRNSGFTTAEAATMRTDMDTFLGTTIPQALGDLTDVDTTTTPPVAGDALIFDDTDGTFKPGAAAGSLATIEDRLGTSATDVDDLYFYDGFSLDPVEEIPGRVVVALNWGGTGNKALPARSDHYHTTPTTTFATYTSKGTLSSGSVTLVSTTVTLPAASGTEAAKSYRVRVTLHGTERGNGGSSYYTQAITINGNTRTSTTRQTVGGVPRTVPFVHSQTITGDGTAKTITAALTYSSGDPLTVDAGEIVIDVDCNR